MPKEDLLVVVPYPAADMAVLEQRYQIHVLSAAADPDALLARLAPRLRALATNGEAGAGAALIDALPRLEVIVCYGVGVDAIDLAYAAQRGIRVTNTPDVLTGDVADMGMALLLAAARQIPAGDAHVRAGQWGATPLPLTTRMFGKRLGILGLGRVGRALARRAAAFDMAIAYHDRVRFADIDCVDYAFCEDVMALAHRSDFLVLCAAANDANRALIGREVLGALGPQGILVNIARGSLVNEPALLDALESRRILGAALDVFCNEPAIDRRFAQLPNVVLQPHRSSATVETRAAMAQLVRDNLQAFFSGQPLASEVRIG